MHVAGATVCFLGFVFGIVGFVKKNGYNVVSAICYVLGGLTLSMAVLQFVSIVDDEMQPRMKPKGTGEPSSFSYTYGIPFTIAALSFMPVQLCVYLQIQIYFKRYPSPETKTKVVPGLQILCKSLFWLQNWRLFQCPKQGKKNVFVIGRKREQRSKCQWDYGMKTVVTAASVEERDHREISRLTVSKEI